MNISRSGSRPSGQEPAEWFTGTAYIDRLFQAPDPARVASVSVTFEPVRGRPGTRILWVRR